LSLSRNRRRRRRHGNPQQQQQQQQPEGDNEKGVIVPFNGGDLHLYGRPVLEGSAIALLVVFQ